MELAIEMRTPSKKTKHGKPKLKALPDALIGAFEVDNPYYHIDEPTQPKRIIAMRALRDDPLAKLHSRGYIGEGELQAGRKLQALFEAVEIGSISSQDPAREYVDGGGQVRDFLTAKRQASLALLAGVREGLGQAGYDICRSFLAERKTIEQIALAHHRVVTKAAITYMGHRFRECLKTASVILGYST